MKLFIFILISNIALGGMKTLMGGMHGDTMGVEYQVLNSGKHVLIAKEKIGNEEKNAKFKILQTIDLNLTTDEYVVPNGFKCSSKRDHFIYGVIAKMHAKKTGSFSPERAWEVDQKNLKLVPLIDIKSISCVWSPEGESGYPFD